MILIRRAKTADGEDGFALVLSILLIVVVAGLSLAMAAVILNQAQPTQESRKSVQTINAAQSGLQVALLNLRAANDGANSGVLNKVPCTSSTGASFSMTSTSAPIVTKGATYTGQVSAAPGTGTPAYRVSVAYFRLDPAGKSPTWLRDNAMNCPLTLVPLYAYLQSYGTGARVPGNAATQANRTQVATYAFSTSNLNVIGGRLRSYGTQQCLDAGTPTPTVGARLTVQPCLALGTPQQTWQYRQDLSIFYGGDTSLKLCIQAPTTGDRALLQACTGSGSGSTFPYASGQQQAQEWGFNDNGHFAAPQNNGTISNGGSCLQPRGAAGNTAAVNGADLAYVSCDNSDDSTTSPSAFDPDPQVGAGKAGGGITGVPGATRQYVNYAQFGRCLDITSQNVDSEFLIAYPCKQAPDSGSLTFNQVWTYPGPVRTFSAFYVTKGDGSTYCLSAPSTGQLVTTKRCQSTAPDSQLWVASGEVTSNYAASYTLTSKSTNRCMAVAPFADAGAFGSTKIILETCDGSSSQKWNAPPVDPTSALSNIQETNVG